MYFIMEGIRLESGLDENEFAPILEGHRALIKDGVERGVILAAGPRTDVAGGFTVMRAKDLKEAEAFFANDPFKIHGLQEYHFKPFEIDEHSPCIDSWL